MVVEDTYSYDGYGVMLSDISGAEEASNADTSLLYAGEQYDSSADMYYNRARYYDPSNGRFNRTDPYAGNSQDPQSLHKYAYCHANPINATDPSGEWVSLVVWSAVALFAAWVFWSRIDYHSFSRWGQPLFYPAWLNGSLEIELWSLNHLHEIHSAGTYKGAVLYELFDAYRDLYPEVTSRTCHYALDDLASGLKKIAKKYPEIKFRSAVLRTTCPEPFNILILVPSVYDTEYRNLKIEGWYKNDEAKKNIIFFYPGSSPVRPVGKLYGAIAQNSWGKFVELDFYNSPPI